MRVAPATPSTATPTEVRSPSPSLLTKPPADSRLTGAYDPLTINSIVNLCPVVHVSFQPDPEEPFPAILPMIGQMGSFARPSAGPEEPLDCYLHGYVSSRIMRLARAAAAADTPGIPVCVAATTVDGLVLSLTPNTHSYNFRSAVLFGYASVVDDIDEKQWAMKLVTNGVVEDRYENSRHPPTGAEMQSTSILRITVDSASAKIRVDTTSDDKADMADEALVARTWTGVVPRYEVLGTPVPGPYNTVAEVPEHITKFIESRNGEAKAYAEKAAFGKEVAPGKAHSEQD
jgi:nitroimidazol reductase NimA-like FMN-containing flavoprotein (pyridoxamine 5'-phosphate oxidase superfamily)